MKTFTPVLLFKNRILKNRLLLLVLSVFTFSLFANSQPLPCDKEIITTNITNPLTDIKYPDCPTDNGMIRIAVGGQFTGGYKIVLMYRPLHTYDQLQPYGIEYTGVRNSVSDPEQHFTFSDLSPNYYCFYVVADDPAYGCDNRDIPLYCSPCTFDFDLTAPPLTCESSTTSITVNPEYGVGFLQFSLNGGPFQDLNVFAGLGAGTYEVTVRNTFDHALNPHFPPLTCDKKKTIVINNPNCDNGVVCTYTQGYYGNKSGKSCDVNGNKISTEQQIINSINAWGGTIVLGNATRNVTVGLDDVDEIILYLPGGERSYSFIHNGTIDFSSAEFKQKYVDQKKLNINSQLLSQTLTLALNLKGLNSSLSNVPLNDPSVSYSIFINTAVYNALTVKTVGGLYQLANEALAGNVPAGLTLSMISDAVDRVNNAYNGCITIKGNSATPFSCEDGGGKKKSESTGNDNSELSIAGISTKLAVTASPNPYRDNIRFVIETNVTGKAVLEVYNVLGMKVATPYTGNMIAGQTQVVNFKPTAVKGGGLFYILTIGDKQVTGKLLSAQ